MKNSDPHELGWKSALAELDGRLSFEAPLAGVTWFQVGGRAEVLYRPTNLAALQSALRLTPPQVPITVFGVASNLLIRDGGIDGLVIRLGREFATMETEDNQRLIKLGAAVLDGHVATFACNNRIAGLEFLAGIPGSIGGAVKMNAGAYGSDMSAILHSVSGVTREGEYRELAVENLGLRYRHSNLPEGFIVTEARVKARPGDGAEIAARITEIKSARELTQPVRSRTGGSSFKNPPPESAPVDSLAKPMKAWQLIEGAGCRGLVKGGAQVSELHCNFLINQGTATAADIEGLGEEVRRRVMDKYGYRLEWEIAIIGKDL
ncbi:MAG: UDP-N-acetylmuramate dehydrogenase [Candidatus Pacebacteria bacterium]|nr:UDP-N-acetylmuramate dehydrogenase [Candidatus Paceibacterota bacterium]